MVETAKARLWGDRVRLVRMYLEHPGNWPDGIDTKYGRWYSGHEDYWRERVGHWVEGRWAGGIDDEAAYALWGGVDRLPRANSNQAGKTGDFVNREGEPWVEAGVSRATWYRRKAEEEAAKSTSSGGAGGLP